MKTSIVQSILTSLTCLLLCGCMSTEPSADTKPQYVQVSSRNLSDVAATSAPLPDAMAPIARELHIGESLRWIDGAVYENWLAVSLRERSLGYGDPILADVYFGMKAEDVPLPSGYWVGEEVLGILYWVDDRVVMWMAPSGAPVVIFEQPLSKADALALEEVLDRLEFRPGAVDGVVDEETRAALNLYLESKGLRYRFATPVVNCVLFKSLTGRDPES